MHVDVSGRVSEASEERREVRPRKNLGGCHHRFREALHHFARDNSHGFHTTSPPRSISASWRSIATPIAISHA